MPTLEELLATRGVVQLRAQASRVTKVRITYPKQPELQLAASLDSLFTTANDLIVSELEPKLYLVSDRVDAPIELESVIEGLRIRLVQLLRGSDVEDQIRASGNNVDQHVRKELARLIAIAPEVGGLSMQAFIDQFTQQSLAQLQGILSSQLDLIREILNASANEGLRVEEISNRLQQQLGLGKDRAILLARDQVGSLNGDIQQHRQQNIGITHYHWDSSLDEKVRLDHRILQGTRQSWAHPPVTDRRSGKRNHPGKDILCRCQAIPEVAL